MLTRLRDDERGVAMIIAVSVAFVVLLLVLTIIVIAFRRLEKAKQS